MQRTCSKARAPIHKCQGIAIALCVRSPSTQFLDSGDGNDLEFLPISMICQVCSRFRTQTCTSMGFGRTQRGQPILEPTNASVWAVSKRSRMIFADHGPRRGVWHEQRRDAAVFVNAVPTVLKVGAAFVYENRARHPVGQVDDTLLIDAQCLRCWLDLWQ
jgi:hypothetical protein